jgi:hypothetical protein
VQLSKSHLPSASTADVFSVYQSAALLRKPEISFATELSYNFHEFQVEGSTIDEIDRDHGQKRCCPYSYSHSEPVKHQQEKMPIRNNAANCHDQRSMRSSGSSFVRKEVKGKDRGEWGEIGHRIE